MGLTLLIEWPGHPDWKEQKWDIELGVPFYLIGSEGKYTVFVQTEERTEPGPCYGPDCDHVSHHEH